MPESYKYPSAIKRQVEPAHRELVHRGFLSRGLRGARPGRHQVQPDLGEAGVFRVTQEIPLVEVVHGVRVAGLRPVRNLMPKTLADRALIATLEVARGAGEGELLLFGGHRWQGIYESFGPRPGKDDLAFASFTVPVDEELPVSGDSVRELFSAHRTPPGFARWIIRLILSPGE